MSTLLETKNFTPEHVEQAWLTLEKISEGAIWHDMFDQEDFISGTPDLIQAITDMFLRYRILGMFSQINEIQHEVNQALLLWCAAMIGVPGSELGTWTLFPLIIRGQARPLRQWVTILNAYTQGTPLPLSGFPFPPVQA